MTNTRRTGASLIEVVGVMAVAGMVTAISFSLIATLMRYDSGLDRANRSRENLARLAETFRAQVHQYRSSEITIQDQTLSASCPGVSCTFEVQSGHVQLKCTSAGESGNRTDRFQLPSGWEGTWEQDPTNGLFSLKLVPSAADSNFKGKGMTISAAARQSSVTPTVGGGS
ncbi:MAG: hypothetical protein KDA78_06080 [Planctomycetaceae bacterium]|nr:hypothetical protein [Planctomycetaceae bacterium]